MSPAEAIFEEIADEIARRAGVVRNRRGSLVTVGARSSVRAMTSRGHVVVKLSPARTASLVAAGIGCHYKDQANAWLELRDDADSSMVRALVYEAVAERRGRADVRPLECR